MGSALTPNPISPTIPQTCVPTFGFRLCFCPNCQSHAPHPSVNDETLLPACPFNCGFRVGQTLFHGPNCPYWPPYKAALPNTHHDDNDTSTI
jgi:hypothetical protein